MSQSLIGLETDIATERVRLLELCDGMAFAVDKLKHQARMDLPDNALLYEAQMDLNLNQRCFTGSMKRLRDLLRGEQVLRAQTVPVSGKALAAGEDRL
jgi:hypothetical protein